MGTCWKRTSFTLKFILIMLLMPVFVWIMIGMYLLLILNQYILMKIISGLSFPRNCFLHYLFCPFKWILWFVFLYLCLWVSLLLSLPTVPFLFIPGYYINAKSYCRIMKWWSKKKRRDVAMFKAEESALAEEEDIEKTSEFIE